MMQQAMQVPIMAPAPVQRGYTTGGAQPPLNDLIEYQQHPWELVSAILNILMDIYREAEIFPNENMTQLSNLVNSRAQQPTVKEITDKYLEQNKIQFQQYLHRNMDR